MFSAHIYRERTGTVTVCWFSLVFRWNNGRYWKKLPVQCTLGNEHLIHPPTYDERERKKNDLTHLDTNKSHHYWHKTDWSCKGWFLAHSTRQYPHSRCLGPKCSPSCRQSTLKQQSPFNATRIRSDTLNYISYVGLVEFRVLCLVPLSLRLAQRRKVEHKRRKIPPSLSIVATKVWLIWRHRRKAVELTFRPSLFAWTITGWMARHAYKDISALVSSVKTVCTLFTIFACIAFIAGACSISFPCAVALVSKDQFSKHENSLPNWYLYFDVFNENKETENCKHVKWPRLKAFGTAKFTLHFPLLLHTAPGNPGQGLQSGPKWLRGQHLFNVSMHTWSKISFVSCKSDHHVSISASASSAMLWH